MSETRKLVAILVADVHCAIRLLTKNSSYNAAIVADDGLTGLSVPMFPKPRDGPRSWGRSDRFAAPGAVRACDPQRRRQAGCIRRRAVLCALAIVLMAVGS